MSKKKEVSKILDTQGVYQLSIKIDNGVTYNIDDTEEPEAYHFESNSLDVAMVLWRPFLKAANKKFIDEKTAENVERITEESQEFIQPKLL